MLSALTAPVQRLLWLPIVFLAGCAVNPVTGKNELMLLDESQEISMGAKQFEPTQQSQGGRYISDPDLTRYVSEIGQRLARVADRSLPYEFVIIDDSTPNAWALPGGKIAVNRGLLTKLNSEAELAAVLSHEIVHAAARHSAKSIERGMLLSSVIGVASSAIDQNAGNYGRIFDNGAQLGAQFIVSSYGREAELESDAYGMIYMMRAGFDPEAAVSLQETFVQLSKGQSNNWLDGMLASHPPSQERVEKNRDTAQRLKQAARQDLTLGFDRYQSKLNRLSQQSQAYNQTQTALIALKEGDLSKAQSEIQTALEQSQSEAQIHSAAGQIAMARQEFRQAQTHFSAAIKINPNHFRYFLGRGLAAKALNQSDAARADLQQSQALFSSQAAAKALAELGG
ncbi:M48 family metalloprotease [Pseudomonadales bacterium]|nr:M48 family metalloprotease [Pseudomonadales bacterium]